MKIVARLSAAVLISVLSLALIGPAARGACSLAPIPISPANGAQLNTICPLLTWDCQSDPEASYSRMQVSRTADFSSVVLSMATSAHQGETSHRFTDNLDKSTTYYWRSQLYCGSGDGPWSTIWSFRTSSGGTLPGSPSLSSPPDGAVVPLGSTDLRVSWNTVPGGVEYAVLRWDAVSGTDYLYVGSGDYYNLANLKPDHTYYWKVMARNSYAWGEYSPPRSFRQSLSLPSGDYDGDGSSDIAIFRASSGLWAIRGLTRFYFGKNRDLPVSGDYDGDGTTEVAVFHPSSGLWAVRYKTRFYFGEAADLPVPADYDGDGASEAGIFRGETGLWAVRGVTHVYYGALGDAPCPGDYDGDGTAEYGIFRSATGLWSVPNAAIHIYFGQAGDWPVAADYSGVGLQLAVFRESTGLWAVKETSRWYLGEIGDIPIPGDYNHSSRDAGAVFRPATGLWAVRGETRAYFGGEDDLPVSR